MKTDLTQRELYEVRNYKTAESSIFGNFGQAHLVYGQRRKKCQGWALSRVSDGAMWQGSGFGPRIYTQNGDLLRLQRAAALLRLAEMRSATA